MLKSYRYRVERDVRAVAILASLLTMPAGSPRAYGAPNGRPLAPSVTASVASDSTPSMSQALDTTREGVCHQQSQAAERAMAGGDAVGSVAALDKCLARWSSEITSQGVVSDSALIAEMFPPRVIGRAMLLLLQRERLRYALVGHPVPAPIVAPYWLNVPTGTTHLEMTAPLTLLEFAVPGCPHCDSAHAVVRRLVDRYRDGSLKLLVVSVLNGKTPTLDSATVEQELAYNQKYWRAEIGEDVPVAVTSYTHEDNTHIAPRPALFRDYGANGVPTFFLIDQHGIIRYATEGVDSSLEARLSAAIARIRHGS